MNCPRCQGLVVSEVIFAENCWIDDIYCVNCGERFFPKEKQSCSMIETPIQSVILPQVDGVYSG